MRLHTSLYFGHVYDALRAAKMAGKVTEDVHFVVYSLHGSRSHERSFEIQLGTYDKHSLPAGTKDQYGKTMHVRRYKNGGDYGASDIYAATYFEWGWFMLAVFEQDPDALFGSKSGHGYNGVVDFHEKTRYAFDVDQ